MTAQSQLDMQELGVDEAKLATDRARLAEAGITVPNGAEHGTGFDPPPKSRRTRSDAGTKRTPKPEQPAGKLSREQVAHIDVLRVAIQEAAEAADQAGKVYLDAQAAFYGYLEEITAK
jgi:hypothetical protein